MMKTRVGLLFSLTVLALMVCAGIAAAAPVGIPAGQADSIAPYNGPVGPGNSLYGLKLAFENLDESFTFNQSERLEKQISHADLRLAELKRELLENRTESADIALEQYRLKINQTDEVLEPVPVNGTGTSPAFDETGLMHAREMIAKHQQVLGDLLQTHPNNTGLERAYENSRELGQKLERKIETVRGNQQQTGQPRSSGPVLLENRTLTGSGTGRQAGNFTGPIDESQLQDRNAFAGNTTQNKDRNELGVNQSPQDTVRQQGNNSRGNDQPGQNGQQVSNGNNNAPADNQQINTDQTQNTGNNNNIPKPTDTGNKNSNGNGNGNTRPAGR